MSTQSVSAENNTQINPYESDIRLIHDVVKKIEEAHNSKQARLFSDLFIADGIFVTAGGIRLNGKDEIFEFTNKALQSFLSDSYARYEVVNIRFLYPDVAIVHGIQHVTTKNNEVLPEGLRGSPLYVVVKANNEWLIVTGQNTIIEKSP